MRNSKRLRHDNMREILKNQPFLTDEEIAGLLACSIQTIRLDRVEMGIPEVRERIRKTALEINKDVRAIATSELVGELIDLELGHSAISIMLVSEDMLAVHSGVVRAYSLFAQANSLALAVIDAPAAVTGVANIKYRAPVKMLDKIVAKAEVNGIRGDKYFITVRSRVDSKEVFKAKFILVSRSVNMPRGVD